MNKLTFLRQNSLDRLQTNIPANQHCYSDSKQWLSSYFHGGAWMQESNIVQADSFQLHMPISKTELCDLENTRVLYTALRHLTPLQASDPRLWTYMTHVTHWEYMRVRWPIEQYLGKQNMRENMQLRRHAAGPVRTDHGAAEEPRRHPEHSGACLLAEYRCHEDYARGPAGTREGRKGLLCAREGPRSGEVHGADRRRDHHRRPRGT
jgi:hypothetical protein